MKKIATISAYHNKKALALQDFLLKHHNFINLNDNAHNFTNNFANDFANDTQLEYFPDDEIPF